MNYGKPFRACLAIISANFTSNKPLLPACLPPPPSWHPPTRALMLCKEALCSPESQALLAQLLRPESLSALLTPRPAPGPSPSILLDQLGLHEPAVPPSVFTEQS